MQPERDILKFFSEYIEKEVGIVFSDFNSFQLQNRLEKIAQLKGVKSVEELYQIAQRGLDRDFRTLLLDIATNNETSFFRDPRVFNILRDVVLPKLIETSQATGRKIKIWSAACSAGQEPLSLAMLIREKESLLGQSINVSIRATDVSGAILKRATEATYSQLEIQRGLPAPMMLKYFTQNPDSTWTASASLRSMIRYESINLLLPFQSAESYDLVLCRNVLIYQKVCSKTKIIEKIEQSLESDGYLILGAGESLLGIENNLKTITQDGTIYFARSVTSEKTNSLLKRAA